MQKRLLQILQIFFALLLLTTAIGKLLDNRGFAEVIATYQLLPPALNLSIGLMVSLFELFLGLFIMFGRHLKYCALLTILMHIGYLLLATTSLMRGLQLTNCGCFGVFLARPLGMSTVIEDSVLIIISVLFYFVTTRQGAKNESK